MYYRVLAALLGTFLAVSVRAGEAKVVETVTGRVLLDANGSGKVDDGDEGLANMLVSDGIQFVRTAPDGTFALKVADDPLIPYKPAQVITVCWPSGTWPVARRFYVRRADIKPGENVEFLLREQKQALPFTFAHGTDPHDNTCGGELFRTDIEGMSSRVKFCLMTGDLGYAGRDGAEKMFTSLREATLRFPIPLLHAPGNHDICDIHSTHWTDQNPLAGYGPYTKYLGPLRYSFDYAGIHFVGLDWARIKEDGKLETGVPDTVIDWVKRDLSQLKPGTRIFLFMHHDFRHGDDKFWDVLVQHKAELVLAGHSHRNKEETRRGIKRLTTQNLCGPYRLVTIGAKGHDIVNRCFTGNASGHVHSYAGKCKMIQELGSFKGKRGPHKEVVLQEVKAAHVIDGFKSRQLELLAEVDPGTATSFGLRFAKTQLSLNAADELHIGDVQTTSVRGRMDRSYRVWIVMAENKLMVQVNNRVEYEKTFAPNEATTVELFAEGGTATFRKVDLWEIKGQ